MSDYPIGARIIDCIDRFIGAARSLRRRHRAGEFSRALAPTVGRLEKFFLLAGGIALAIGLAANTDWWPWRVHVVYHDPIVHVDWERFISGLKSLDPDGEWREVLVQSGISTSTAHLGWVVYRLQWYNDTGHSIEHMRRIREIGGRTVTPGMVNDWTIGLKLKAAKSTYAYRDSDTARNDFGEFFNPFEPNRFIASLTESPSMAILRLAPHSTGNTGQDYLADVFYLVGERIQDRLQRAHFYESLRGASTFFTPFEIRNDGHAAVANLKIAIAASDQEVVQEFLDVGAISRGDKISNLQLLNIPVLPARRASAIVLKSTNRPLPDSGLFLQERPIVTQVADYWFWILIPPAVIVLI